MKPENAIYWVILSALILWVAWLWKRYDQIEFEDPEIYQVNRPQIEKGTTRWGIRTLGLQAEAVEQDVIVRFKVPRTAREHIARVVARAGDRVKIEDGKVHVNGSELKDEYGRRKVAGDFFPELIVPEGAVFVLNDVRFRDCCDRLDSRALGPIPLGAVKHVFRPQKRMKRTRSRGPKR